MTAFKIFALAFAIVLVGALFPPFTTSQTTTGEWQMCTNGSELIQPPECPGVDPEHPVYFPFPYDCRQYYECTNNIARCLRCAPRTIWDQTNTICNHPSVVNCTIVTTPVPTTTPTTWTTTGNTTPSEITEDPGTPTTLPTAPSGSPTQISTIRPPQTTEDPSPWVCPEMFEGLIRHPFNCSFYYDCAPGRPPYLQPCPSGLYFSPDINRCDYPYNVTDCVGGTPPAPTRPTTVSLPLLFEDE